MVKFQTRIMVGVFVLVDVVSTVLAWVLAYFLRFHSDLVLEALPASKGVPAFSRYLVLIPVIVVLWPERHRIDAMVRFDPASIMTVTRTLSLSLMGAIVALLAKAIAEEENADAA